jgi:uncharacterized protein YcbK (DUF882 family)
MSAFVLPAFSRSLQLSKNFALSECVSRNDPWGWSELQSGWATYGPRLFRLFNGIWQPARDHLGPITMTSVFRSRAHNQRIGGAKLSRHLEADAGDGFPHAASLPQLHAFLATLPAVGGLAMGSGFVHADARPRVGGQIVRWTY